MAGKAAKAWPASSTNMSPALQGLFLTEGRKLAPLTFVLRDPDLSSR
jgi:hypothetical protein